ncbi:MAG: serine/threonine-protein kinase, partial [Myxococcota bacterium]
MDLILPDRYELSSSTPLGEGGMARVYPARDVLLDVPVALKVVRPELAREPNFQRRFDLEIRLSARLSHPRVVPLHDHGRTPDDLPFIGLAYADLGHLLDLRKDPPAWPELLRLGLELLDALGYLHARDVLHRDVKPRNVLLHEGDDGRPHVWLADLGLASLQSVASQTIGQRVGTPGYMAPEQSLGQPREAGPWTDLFSVGVILWELLTGHLPYAPEASPDATPLPTFVPRIDVPRGLRQVLGNLLRPEPLGRYDLAADLATELLALGEPDAPAGEPIDPPEPGIVAPGCPPIPPEPEADDDAVDEPDDRALLGLVDETKSVVPIYNRPFPEGMPATVPPPPRSRHRPPASLQLWALREPVLLAREPQRQAIWDVARQIADDGQGRVVFLVGDAGSGKSYLAGDLVRTLEAGGWAESVRIGYHLDPTDRDGYAGAARQLLRPFNETPESLEARLRRRLARERESLDRPVAQEARDLARWCLPDEAGPTVPTGVGLRELYRHLKARQWRRLAVMVLDDVHHAPPDDEGLAIPEALLQRWSEDDAAPWLVIVTIGSEELAANPGLADRVDRAVEHGALRIVL